MAEIESIQTFAPSFFKESDLMWITITLVALRFSDTSFTFPQTPETTKIAGSRIFSDSSMSLN